MLITLKLLPKNSMQCNAQLENMENLVLNNHNPTLKYNEEIEINKKIQKSLGLILFYSNALERDRKF